MTGHAHWPDIPQSSQRTQPIIDFHQNGFDRLKQGWQQVKKELQAFEEEGVFLTFPGFEIHSCAHGDYTIVYRNFDGEIIYADIPDLFETMDGLSKEGIEAIAFPHHVAYQKGRRGINWDTFSEEHSPVVEMVSLHGCSETDEGCRPFLGVMGPSNRESTIQSGLEQGHRFGVIGSTDHHFAHPGSYGHGLTGVWAAELTHHAIWEAIQARRTYALTGDRMALEFTLNDEPMGAIAPAEPTRQIAARVSAGGPIDYVDVVKNNQLLRRFSVCDVRREPVDALMRTKLYLELGWGHYYDDTRWDVEFGVSDGRIVSVEPRFQQAPVYTPFKAEGNVLHNHNSQWEAIGAQKVHFETQTRGNPNYFTNTNQGMCLEVEMPRTGAVIMSINGEEHRVPLERLLKGSKTGDISDEIEVPAWKLHRAPLPWEFIWDLRTEERAAPTAEKDVYYVRVRQTNDQWAWSSPIFVGY